MISHSIGRAWNTYIHIMLPFDSAHFDSVDHEDFKHNDGYTIAVPSLNIHVHSYMYDDYDELVSIVNSFEYADDFTHIVFVPDDFELISIVSGITDKVKLLMVGMRLRFMTNDEVLAYDGTKCLCGPRVMKKGITDRHLKSVSHLLWKHRTLMSYGYRGNFGKHELLCKRDGCSVGALYGDPIARKPEYCAKHCPVGYEDVVSKQCLSNGCNTQPTYGDPIARKSEYCATHAPPEYEDVANKQCLFVGCKTRPSYGDPIARKPEYCAKHCPVGYEDVVSKQCLSNGCNTQPTYGDPIARKPEYCAKHCPVGYEDVVSKQCLSNGCVLHPSYGDPITRKPEYCSTHAPLGYEDVVNKQCLFVGCKTQPTYGDPITHKSEYCANHAPLGYEDVVNKQCLSNGCKTRPTYGDPIARKPEYCAKHCPVGYEDVVSKQCLFVGCKTQPTYGDPIARKPEYCAKHCPVGYEDVKNPHCLSMGCKTQASYGDPITRNPKYCVKHAPLGYENVVGKQCISSGCKTRPSYGMAGYSPIYCAQHKNIEPNMVKDSTKYINGYITCSYCCTKIHYTEQFCSSCQYYIDNGQTHAHHMKEHIIKKLLEDHSIDFVHDKIVVEGCSRLRPDFRILTTWGEIILEVDEHQHNRRTYTPECEITRMKQIYFDVGVEKLQFIRYNPDSFKGGKHFTKAKRHTFLIKYLQECIEGKTIPETLGVVYLFYDGFDNTSVSIQEIEPYH
jgi:hypothetical protein